MDLLSTAVLTLLVVAVDGDIRAVAVENHWALVTKSGRVYRAQYFPGFRYKPDRTREEHLGEINDRADLTIHDCMSKCEEFNKKPKLPNEPKCMAFNFCEENCQLWDGIIMQANWKRCILLSIGLEHGRSYPDNRLQTDDHWTWNHFKVLDG